MRLLLLACAFVAAFGLVHAQIEPPNVAPFRSTLKAEAKARGIDPEGCEVKYHESSEQGHFVTARCRELSIMCVFLIHPTREESALLACIDNPDYVPPKRIDNRTQM